MSVDCSIDEFIDVINSLGTSEGLNFNKHDWRKTLRQECL